MRGGCPGWAGRAASRPSADDPRHDRRDSREISRVLVAARVPRGRTLADVAGPPRPWVRLRHVARACRARRGAVRRRARCGRRVGMVSNPGGVTAAHGGCPARISAGPTAPAPVPAGFGSHDAGRGGRLIAGSPSRHGGDDVLPEPYQRRHRDVARHAYRVGGHVAEVEPEQACALFSHLPSADGYRYEDVTTEVAACDPPLPPDVFAGGVPSQPIAIRD